jgi:hypothetical protein
MRSMNPRTRLVVTWLLLMTPTLALSTSPKREVLSVPGANLKMMSEHFGVCMLFDKVGGWVSSAPAGDFAGGHVVLAIDNATTKVQFAVGFRLSQSSGKTARVRSEKGTEVLLTTDPANHEEMIRVLGQGTLPGVEVRFRYPLADRRLRGIATRLADNVRTCKIVEVSPTGMAVKRERR